MTLPAISAIRMSLPTTRICVLAKPWVAEIYRLCPDIDEVFLYESPGIHAGVAGIFRLARKLKEMNFDAAILLQNAIEAAIIVKIAAIPIRAGYNSDCRGLLMTHSVVRTKAVRALHQTEYYLEMVKALGCRLAEKKPNIRLDDDYRLLADSLLKSRGLNDDRIIVGMAPGAAYGPAKRWFPERFAAVAGLLIKNMDAQVILLGSAKDRENCKIISKDANGHAANMAGETSLKEAVSLIGKCRIFISNDSGLMHVAGALGIPTVAIFGSTNPVATSPLGDKNVIIRKELSCSPCLKEVCATDFKCMDMVTVDDVYKATESLLSR